MKKSFITFLLTLLVALFGLVGLTACDNPSSPTTPQKLNAPIVTLTDNVATWEADSNADKFEISLDGNLSYVENTITTKTLTNGQTLKVRAVGDGSAYSTSDWSNAVTYTVVTPTPQPTKLGTPAVTISSTGLASWAVVANANSYVYKIDGGTETPTTATSVQLADGQSITVKAVGDGTSYTDSDYSVTQAYTASTPTPTPTEAPTYLGIIASNEEPTENEAPSGLMLRAFALYSTRISLEEALRNYLSNSDNSLGDTVPTESNYEIYSSIGNTVYIQIWLDNPDQNTILSLKLNGTKYQSGGALQSFFIEDGDSYLNCVYVAVTIPTNSYNFISYEVTEIEYVEGTNISQDGKAVLIDEENDTVSIGLPYEQSLPTATVSNGNSTAKSISFDINVADEDNFVDLVGGWLRVVIYDQSNEILAQQKLTEGNNTVTFNNLSADTHYNVMAFVLGDVHDGNGVYVHNVASAYYRTQSVISCELESEILLNAQTGKYYPVINVEAELGDTSFTFTKIEVGDWDGEVYYTGEFGGSINVTEGILNGQSYVVKVYYENASGIEQSYQDSVYVERLDYPWILETCLQYGLMDDAILGFDFGTNKSNFDNLTIKIIDEYSKQYLAEDAIYLIDNPNALAELEAQWQSYGEGWDEIYDRWYKLDNAQTKINKYYSDVKKAEWQTELAKGIYSYEYVYGEDEEFFKVGNKYYVVLDGYQSQRVNDYSWEYTLSADFDLNDGEGVEEDRTIIEGWFDVKPAIGKNDYLFAEEYTLDENGVVYLEVKSRNNLGGESYRELGYVNQIVLADGYDILQVLWTQDEPNHDIDEAAWMMDAINALKAGEDVHTAFPLGELEAITFDLDDIPFDSNLIGNYAIRFTYIMYGKEYTGEDPYDWDGSTIDYTVEGALPQATIEFVGSGDDFGRWEIASPDWVKNGIWNFGFTLEIRDENQQLVGTFNQDNYGEYERLPLNYSIRVRLDSYADRDYYTQGAWSEWFVCTPITLSSPTNFSQSYTGEGVSVRWEGVNNAEKYVYVVNGGAEQETYETEISGLKNGDIIKVKAIPFASDNSVQSAYSDEFTVTDSRMVLAKPTVTFDQDYFTLVWQAVENASYYNIYYAETGEIVNENIYGTECMVQVGNKYVVVAIPADYETYCPSESNIVDTTIKLQTPTVSIDESGNVTFNVDGKTPGRLTYTYVINDGVEQTTKSKSGEITLNQGDSIKVKISFGNYEDSDWSESVTYTTK